MYALACCDNNGKCFGFLGKDKVSTVSEDSKLTEEFLAVFKKKQEANELCLQINLGHMLLPNGRSYRVVPVRM